MDQKTAVPQVRIQYARLLDPFFRELYSDQLELYNSPEKTYLDFLSAPAKLRANKDHDNRAPDYMRAWEIVDATGANEIIARFKSLY